MVVYSLATSMTNSRYRKLAGKLGHCDDARGDDIPGLKEIFVARDQEICVRRQRGGQKWRVFGVTRKRRHARRAVDIYGPNSVLKKGDRHVAAPTYCGDFDCRSEPVPVFQRPANRKQ